MSLFRSLLIPFYPTSLLFVGFSGLILAFAMTVGIFAIFPATFLLMWLFKYGYVMLEHVANGGREAPVIAVEMLGPMEVRPWVQLILAAAVGYAIWEIGGQAGSILTIVALFLLPASVGALGMGGSFTDAFNPVALWRMLWGLSYYYLIVLIVIAAIVYLMGVVNGSSIWPALKMSLLELAVLTIFSFIGGAIYARRVPLGFEPRNSPERKQAKQDAERVRERQRMLDDVYQCITARHYQRVDAPIGAWLNASDVGHLNEDVEVIASAAIEWRNPHGTVAVMRGLIGWLVSAGKPGEAFLILRKALANQPEFTLESESQALALAQYADSTGQPHFALQLLKTYEQRHPTAPLSATTRQFCQRLAEQTNGPVEPLH